MRISLNIQIEKPSWWYKIFPCRHEVVLVEENFISRYGSHTSYWYCLKCKREGMSIERNCKHELNCFGVCMFCLTRQTKLDCTHEGHWVREPDTDDYYCENCGEWKDEEHDFKNEPI